LTANRSELKAEMTEAAQSDKPELGSVVVTGGCGFLGHHIVGLLVSSYSCQITVIDVRITQNQRPDSDGVATLTPIFSSQKLWTGSSRRLNQML